MTGGWLERTVTVNVRDQAQEAFTVHVDEKQVWSPKMKMSHEVPGSKKFFKEGVIFTHVKGKFSIAEIKSTQTPGVRVRLSDDPNLLIEIRRPVVEKEYNAQPAHLNLNVQGLEHISSSLGVGGLLGSDDHSFWSAEPEGCKHHHKQEMFLNLQEDVSGSIASASL